MPKSAWQAFCRPPARGAGVGAGGPSLCLVAGLDPARPTFHIHLPPGVFYAEGIRIVPGPVSGEGATRRLDARQQAALSARVGADAFIGKDETPERVAEYLRQAAGRRRP